MARGDMGPFADPGPIKNKVTHTQLSCIIENKDNFSDKDWKNLYKISEETFVEETDSLKHGAAGAGLTDND